MAEEETTGPKTKAKPAPAKRMSDELRVRSFLEMDRERAGPMFRLDTFSGETQLVRQIPLTSKELDKPRPVTDIDVFHCTCWLQSQGFVKISKSMMNTAIDVEATENAYSAAQAMLDNLPEWDGIERVDDFLTAVCGAEVYVDGDDEDAVVRRGEYVKAVSRKLFLSLIARITRPGCKVDTLVVLEGAQGTRKSSLLRAMCFGVDEWFSDSMPPISSKDARAHLAGKMIIELSEVDHLKTAGSDAMKVFLSAQDDKFRPSYGRREVLLKRQCVFIGTTNDTMYLKDMTGNRRFWVIKISEINLELAAAEMPQIWAEALIASKAGETHWFDDHVEAIAREEQEDRTAPEAWTEVIRDWIRTEFGKTTQVVVIIPISQLMSLALGIPFDRQDRSAATRVGMILSKIGAKRTRRGAAGSFVIARNVFFK
jgi:predicted P-loop ATPase